MRVTRARIIHQDNMGREVGGPGYPLLIVLTDIGELVIGMDQMPLLRGYAVAMVLNENKLLKRIRLSPTAAVERPLEHPLTVENATDDPVVVSLVREFLARVERGETPAALEI
jgi:hypothetical protein